MRLSDGVRTDTGWEIIEDVYEPSRAVTKGSNLLCGNGAFGYRGTRPDQTAEEWVGWTVADTYDMADGKWRELCNVPNGLYVDVRLNGEELTLDPSGFGEESIDLATGEFGHEARWVTASGRLARVRVRRVASYTDLRLLCQRMEVLVADPNADDVLSFRAGIDAQVWSLNGDHFASTDFEHVGSLVSTRSLTVERGIEIAVASRTEMNGDRHLLEEPEFVGFGWFDRPGDDGVVRVDTFAAVSASTGELDPTEAAKASVVNAAESGYESVAAATAANWEDFWSRSDVVIDGDPVAQAAIRFSIYHNRICTPAHSDRLPIGARGLSCQAYQGAAFWDQELFNLPAFLFTEPGIARNLLTYRWRTLDGARHKARELGYEGAFYAWISGDTGEELCPDFFFVDVLTGRPIRNHFNDWQIHVSPDIAFTVWRYYAVTDDWSFVEEKGAEIIFEVARFLQSFIKYNDVRNRYEVIRLLGPDEWHENVDNNFYTNHVTRLALGYGVRVWELMGQRSPARLADLRRQLGYLSDETVDHWRRMADLIYVPEPDPESGLIEQFDGFFDLEDCRPVDLEHRLQDPSEYWGWPNGVAYFTQVSKQPDVVQLFAVDHTFDLAVQKANYDYYEPRCAKESSLSHAVHALVATRLGYTEQAYEHFMKSATVDLLSTNKPLVGGTFIGGMHTAACGGAYQAAVFGFGGLSVAEGVVEVAPHLPSHWVSISYGVVFRDQQLRVTAGHDGVTVTAAAANTGPVLVRCHGGAMQTLGPGDHVDA